MNLRPSGYEPDELPGCSIPRCFVVCLFRENLCWVLIRFGGALLSHVLRRSTIGATALNFRVREGTGCFARAVATKPNKDPTELFCSEDQRVVQVWYSMFLVWLSFTGSDQAYRAISTGQLNALLHLHLRPIDVVVFHGPQGYLVLRGASRLDAFSGYPVRS